MPKLKTIYDKAEEIPEGYAELYAEKNGKFELTQIAWRSRLRAILT